MKDFDDSFSAAVAHSRAHATFCERVFGRDLAQSGFADLGQLALPSSYGRDPRVPREPFSAEQLHARRLYHVLPRAG